MLKLRMMVYLMAVFAGVLSALSFPKPSLWPLIFLSFPFLIHAIFLSKTRAQAFTVGFLCAFTSGIISLYWLVYTLSTYGGMSLYIALTVFLLLNMLLSLYPAVGSILVREFYTPGGGLLSLTFPPSTFTLAEYLRGNLFTGFPWMNFGYALVPSKVLIQVADIGGVYLLSFIVYLAGTLIYEVLEHFTLRRWNLVLRRGLAILFLFFIWSLYGATKMQAVRNALKELPKASFAVAQGNIDQAHKWDPAFRQITLERYFKLTRKIVKKEQVDAVIWPETATPFYFLHEVSWSRMLRDFVASISTPLFFGTPDYRIQGRKIRYYNTALLLMPSGNISGRYTKIHLVPFGEFLPLYEYMKFLEKIFPAAGIFSSGHTLEPLSWGKVRAGVLICYEAVFPELARAMVRKGANVIFNITNDAWFGRTWSPYQHFNIFVLRSVEVRRSMIRSANTGISGAVLPDGTVLKKTEIFKDASFYIKVPLVEGSETLFVKWGDWIVILSLIFAVTSLSSLNSTKSS